MEGAGYVDLFATKGLEYLLVMGFLVALVVFWRVLTHPAPSPRTNRPRTGAGLTPWFRIEPDLYYHRGHSWAALDGDGTVTVGVNDFAQKLLGPAAAVELPHVGTRLEQAERGFGVRVDGRSFGLLSPVDGEVVAVNDELRGSPELLNDDPYGKGWLCKVRVPRLDANLANLFPHHLAGAFMEHTVDALRARVPSAVGAVLQDGGVPVSGIARQIAPKDWDRLVREFLLE